MVERFAFHGLGGRQIDGFCVLEVCPGEVEGHMRTNMLWL